MPVMPRAGLEDRDIPLGLVGERTLLQPRIPPDLPAQRGGRPEPAGKRS